MNERFRFRVWDKEKNKYLVNFSFDEEGDLYTECQCCSGYSASLDNFVIQQCTGLRDSEGQMIYEGDILHAWQSYHVSDYAEALKDTETNINTITVKWGEFNNCGCCEDIGVVGFNIEHSIDDYDKAKIIGNILHERTQRG